MLCERWSELRVDLEAHLAPITSVRDRLRSCLRSGVRAARRELGPVGADLALVGVLGRDLPTICAISFLEQRFAVNSGVGTRLAGSKLISISEMNGAKEERRAHFMRERATAHSARSSGDNQKSMPGDAAFLAMSAV